MITKEQTTLQHALEALKGTTGITGRVIAQEQALTAGLRADARIELQANGQQHGYLVEIKRIDRFVTLAHIKQQCAQYLDQLLLVAPRITADIAEKCRELDLQFIDTAGNAYLHRPNLFVLVTGQRAIAGEGLHPVQQEGKRAGTATNLRVVFALLCKPDLLNAPYRDINRAAGVALGTIGWVFYDLNARGHTVGGKDKGDRVFLEKQRLIQEWVTNYPIKLRPKLNARKFRAPAANWWKNVNITEYGAQWGGEVAAEKLAGYLRPDAFTLYLHNRHDQKNLTRLVADHKLRADRGGDIEILDAFWDFDDEKNLPETVPPLLAYADLIATLDPRNLEAAKLLHDQYLTTPAA